MAGLDGAIALERSLKSMTPTQLTSLRYETATVTLLVTARETAISQWSPLPVVQVLRYHLVIREVEGDELLAEMRGDRTSFLSLVDAVQHYIQAQLTPTATFPTVIAPTDAPIATVSDSEFRLEPQGLTRHTLHLGSLGTIAGNHEVILGTAQLADLGDVFDQLEAQVRCLPVSLVGEQRRPWRIWGTAAAGIVAAVGMTTSLWPLYQSQQLTETAFEAPVSDQSIPESAASSELEQAIAPEESEADLAESEADLEGTDETLPPSDETPNTATEPIAKPEDAVASDIVKQLPRSRPTPAPPDFEISRSQTKPSDNPESSISQPPAPAARPPETRSPVPAARSPETRSEEGSSDSPNEAFQLEEFALNPSIDQTSTPGSGSVGDRPEESTESSEVPREPTFPTTRRSGTPHSAPGLPTEDADSPAREAMPNSGRPNSAETMDATPAMPLSLPDTVESSSRLDLETLTTQLTEAWRPPDALNQPIAYRLTLAPDGSITQIESEDDLAEQYRDRASLPALGTLILLPGTPSQVCIRLYPDGSAEAFPCRF